MNFPEPPSMNTRWDYLFHAISSIDPMFENLLKEACELWQALIHCIKD